jgi:membrane protease YdiL (CAAX protease family)
MRRTWTLLVFILAVFVLGALISPWIYWAAQDLARGVLALRSLADHPFPRFVSRTLLVLAIIGLWPLLRTLGKLSWRELGFVPISESGANISRGFIIGFVTLGALLLIAFACGARIWRGEFDSAKLISAAALSFASAAMVAPLEELIFRGALFGSMRTRGRWLPALSASSVVFALVHFIHTPRATEAVIWTSGFEVLGAMFAGINSATGIAQFLNVSICGALLAWAYQRTRTLYFSIGLHAGWIFWLKLGNALTVTTAAAQQSFWGTRKVIDGWAATVLLLSVATAFPWLLRKKPDSISHVARTSNQTQAVG